jgi:hypothetical protein
VNGRPSEPLFGWSGQPLPPRQAQDRGGPPAGAGGAEHDLRHAGDARTPEPDNRSLPCSWNLYDRSARVCQSEFQTNDPGVGGPNPACRPNDRLGRESHPLKSARPDLRPALTECLRLPAARARCGCARSRAARGLKGIRVLHDTLNSPQRKLRSVLISVWGSLKWRRPGRDSPMVAPWHFQKDNA